MQRNVVLNDQKLIFQNLLEETLREYASIPGKNRGDTTSNSISPPMSSNCIPSTKKNVPSCT